MAFDAAAMHQVTEFGDRDMRNVDALPVANNVDAAAACLDVLKIAEGAADIRLAPQHMQMFGDHDRAGLRQG